MNIIEVKKEIERLLIEPENKSNSFYGFIREFFGGVFKDRMDLDPDKLHNSLIGVGTLYNQLLEISLDEEIINDQKVCFDLKRAISGRFELKPEFLTVISRSKTRSEIVTGIPIAHASMLSDTTYGSLGGFIHSNTGATRIFSNNHVLADLNNGTAGDPIFGYWQTGARPIGSLLNFEPIRTPGLNSIDLAVAQLDQGIAPAFSRTNTLHARNVNVGERVFKTGAATGFTNGVVTSIDYTDRINYERFEAVFIDQIRISAHHGRFSAGGDSGSLVFSAEDGAFVGLHFAGNGGFSLSNRAMLVEGKLRLWGYI